MNSEKYIPAFSYHALTPFYDSVVRMTMREKLFKQSLVEQARIKANDRILDLACGTGTLTILIKISVPRAEITGMDGDPKILKLAREKARAGNFEIHFDEGVSFDLPYPDESFDCVVSSLFFHHLTRENKLKTLREVLRILKQSGEFHVADFGLPKNFLMKFPSYFIKLLDSYETTADNFNGLLPELVADAGFVQIQETNYYNTFFGTIRMHKARKT
jgi:ubiquinone/menaquinone biosynthesis C-methylase UbiE